TDRGARLRRDLGSAVVGLDPAEVTAGVDEDAVADRLPGQARPPGPEGHRPPRGAGRAERAGDLLGTGGCEHQPRAEQVVRGVVGHLQAVDGRVADGSAAVEQCLVQHGQRLIMCPAIPSTASLSASDKVGWAKTLRATSSAVRSHFCASVSAGSSSVTSGPIMWAPRISLYLASATTLTNPTASPSPMALPLAEHGNCAVLTSYPFSLACSSL